MDTLANASGANAPQPIPSRHPNFLLRFLIHHNPFYLLSALCMIAGCYALNKALQTHSGELPKLLLLVATLQLYELLLVALGLYLIVKHGLQRDGRTLLLLDVVFLVDLTFLNSEAAATSLRAGLLVNGIALLLALGKVALVMSVLSVRFPSRAFAFVATQLLVLLGLPCALKWVERPGDMHAGITAGHLYVAWWAAGLLLVLFEVQRRLLGRDPHDDTRGPGVRRDVMNVYAVVPFLSLLTHLGMLHWVYHVDFYLSYAAPVLLGLGVVLGGQVTWFRDRPIQRALAGMLPVAAVILAVHYPETLWFAMPKTTRLTVSPLSLTVAGAYLAWVYTFLLPYAVWFLLAGMGFVATVAFGPSVQQTVAAADRSWTWSLDWFRRLIPKTPMQWGVTAIAFSFAFLGLGAAVSLRKRPPAVEPPAQ